MAQETRPGRVGKRGIQIKTIRRTGGVSSPANGAASGSGSSSTGRVRPKKASVRYREKTMGAAKPGENFFPDAKMAQEFEQRVLEIYAPTPDLNESVRELPLRLQAQRDASAFRLPRLGQLCLEIVAEYLGTSVLPQLEQDEQQSRSATASMAPATSKKGKRTLGIFGLPVPDEDEDEDFVPDTSSGTPIQHRSKRVRRHSPSRDEKVLADVHESNSYILDILPIPAKEALQMLLEKRSPQNLNVYVLGKYFLTRKTVQASRRIRALSTVDGLGDRGIASLLRTLSLPLGDKSIIPVAMLVKLHLQAFTRLTSQQLLPLFNLSANLQEICLRGCISVDAAAMRQLVKSSGKTLRVVNLNWAGVRVEGVEEIVRECPNLEVLKVAHVQNMNDATVTAMMDRITRETIDKGIIPLAKLKKLKITGTHIGIIGLGSLLKHCGKTLESLDISYTRVGGEGALQILLVLLGLHSDTGPAPTNDTLAKLNLSGLSLPEDDLNSMPLESMMALQIFDFRDMRTLPQDSGSHDLACGIKSNLLTYMMMSLGARSLGHPTNNSCYSYERISISNKLIVDKRSWLVDSPISILGHTSVKRLDFSGANLTQVDWYQSPASGKEGCESLNLSGCLLPERPRWELFGAGGRLRRIDLSGTKVSEEDVERLLKLNPYLTSINLTGCRGIPVTRRRRYFETMK